MQAARLGGVAPDPRVTLGAAGDVRVRVRGRVRVRVRLRVRARARVRFRARVSEP